MKGDSQNRYHIKPNLPQPDSLRQRPPQDLSTAVLIRQQSLRQYVISMAPMKQ